MDEIDLTQPISLCYDEDDPVPESNEAAVLKIPVQDGVPRELEFSLFNGVNKIGRSESCEVCISNKILSKEHAVIEVGGDCYLIYDLNSSNKTWRGKKPLKPNVKYKLDLNEEVTFGNIKAQFIARKPEVDGGDSGSETGSESMLLLNEEFPALSMSTPVKNEPVIERSTETIGNASSSNALFSKSMNAVDTGKALSPKEPAVDLENAATQEYNGANLSDSGDETDCEDHLTEKTVCKGNEIHSDRVTDDPQCTEEVVKKQTSSGDGGISVVPFKSHEKLPGHVNNDGSVNIAFPETNFSKSKLPEYNSLECSEDLPPTQLNMALVELGIISNSRNAERTKELNDEKALAALNSSLPETQLNTNILDDSLPETQLNTRILEGNLNLQNSETQQTEINANSSCAPLSSGHVTKKTNKLSNGVLEQKDVIPESDDETDGSDDLPPTQPNFALLGLQFSEEQNFHQRDDSRCSNDKNSLLPRASTSSNMNSFTKTAVPNSLHHAGPINSRKSNIPVEGNFKGSSSRSFTVNQSNAVLLLSSINISVEEGSIAGENSSILCPSTQRRSDVQSDFKIKNTEIHCSPTLSMALAERRKDSIAETPPHLIKESAMSESNLFSTTSFSKQLSELSSTASGTADSASHSPLEIKTSDDLHTPSTSGKPSKEVPTPDSAKAGEINYTGNYSPKVYKTKLNDLGKDSQEITNFVHVSEGNDAHQLKGSSEDNAKEAHPTAPEGLTLIPKNEDTIESSDDDDIGANRTKQSRQNKKLNAVTKTGWKAKVGRSTAKKSPNPCETLKTKKSRTRGSPAASKSPNLDKHSHISHDLEDDNRGKMPLRRRSKTCHIAPDKVSNTEPDTSKSVHFESRPNNDDKKQRSTVVCDEEWPVSEDSVSSTNTDNFKPNTSTRTARKKQCKNDQKVPVLPVRKSKRQKSISNKCGENYDRQDVHGADGSSDLATKENSNLESKDDFVSPPPRRKIAQRKQPQSESNQNVPDSKQSTSFCAFQKTEAVEVEDNSLVDSRKLRTRKAAPSRNQHEDFARFEGQSRDVTHLTLNEGEISVSISTEQSGIAVQCGKSNTDEDLESNASDKNGDASCSLKEKKAALALTELCIPVQKLPLIPQRTSRLKRKTSGGLDKKEMLDDSVNETKKLGDQSSITGKEVESVVNKNGRRLRRSCRKEVSTNDSTDESHISGISLNSNAKSDKDGMFDGLKEINFEKKNAPRSRRLRKKEKTHDSNPTEDCLSSNVSLDSSVRSLRVRVSTSETSADEKSNASEKCQISVFAKDTVKYLIKHDVAGFDSSQSANVGDVQSRASKRLKLSQEEGNETAVPAVKSNPRSRLKRDTEDFSSPPPWSKVNKRRHNLNTSSVTDTISEEVTPSKSKRPKNAEQKHVVILSPSSRQHQVNKPKVMFTMVDDEEPQKVVVNLGGKVVEDVNLCTHLVADKLRRTVKALCCIAKGIPLVNTKWLQECKKMDSFVDHTPYLIKDNAAEKQYKFELRKTLQKAAEKPLLSSWSIHVTSKVMPSPEQMKDIIQCAGGKYLPKMPNRLSEKTVIISCAADQNLCSHAVKCGFPVVGSEFILTGLLQYKIDIKSYMLSKN